ncbi:MAG: hypothetical protein ACLRJV_05570 [Eubacteriales bacterium]
MLVGWDDTSYYLNDPFGRKEHRLSETMWKPLIKAMGSQAIALLPQ